ncbi:peptide chain release factor N(5)-glutamine methyltransferase [Achromobacter arsenitoxydans]|uniref:Release factor glutamine methyltransferase n=1 Tax=Achromobacter arsenitoxydans SY8 TaxID=477184 RepID=H0FD80_9BURK|nr:peptide chain release factor N(5)-glutamine methyltransferase [Achromobacter arsenitoxydans]EHK63873.1 N5-glutamine S-adenosyl-L-methionine-dependent methyltransferase [Achromobacter arsenitoxydans SY8]
MSEPQLKSLLLDARLPRLEVRMLLEHVLAKPRAWLLAHDTDPLAPEVAAAYEALARRRIAGEPMAYLLGSREFMGHMFRVTPDVLIPRPDTEVLVETALECVAAIAGPAVLDLGTGSGAIAISIALARRDARVMASDVSAAALAVAAANAWDLTAAVRFVEGSWYEAVPAGEGFDLIVSNPPYVASDDPHLDQGDLRFEPRGALTDGAGGLDDLRRIVQGAANHLKPGGALWMEHGWDQAQAVRDMLAQAGFQDVCSRKDLAGIERISGGRYPLHPGST